MFSFLTRWFRPEIRISSAEELREGPAIVEGTARLPEEPLVSPFRSVRCIAYSYKAYVATRTRQGTTAPQMVKEAAVYASFPLDIEGATLTAIPLRSAPPVTAEDHRKMAANVGGGFYVQEDAIKPGRRVSLEGHIMRKGDGWEMRYKLMTDLGDGEAGEPQRKRRRKG